MGYGFMAWAVDTDRLKQVVGSKAAKAVHEAFGKAPSVEMDHDTATIVECLRGWFRAAAAKGRGIVCYYH